MKEKQVIFCTCFTSLKLSKGFHKQRKGTKSINYHCSCQRCLGDLTVNDKKIRKITKHFNLISKLGQYKCREHEKGTFLKTVDVPFSFWSKTEKDRYDYSEELNPNNPTGACNVPAWANVDVQQISVPHQILVLK